MILALTKPKYFMPVHGEHRHLMLHARLAEKMGVEKAFVLQNGSTLEINNKGAEVTGVVTADKVLVDGLGVGDVGNIVLRDRKLLAQDGLIIVVVTISAEDGRIISGPDIISRGFVYVRESEDLMAEIKDVARESIEDAQRSRNCDWATIKSSLRNGIYHYIYSKTKRSPMIMPIIMEV